MPEPPSSRRQVFEHLGLVAGLFDALAMGDGLDHATHQNPAMRDLPVGEAVKAMGRNGRGFINPALSLVPRCFQMNPPSRLIAPRGAPEQRNDDALGRTVETLYAYGGTALYSLLAATAAQRLGLAPRFTPLESPSVPVAGRSTSDAEPSAHVVPHTQGYSRAHRPALHHVRRELLVAHHAGLPVLLPPRRGKSREGKTFGHSVQEHMAPWQTPSGATYLGAESARYREANRQPRAAPPIKWMPRGPTTISAAQAALAQAHPQPLRPLSAGERAQLWPSPSGGVAPRWALLSSQPRQPQAQRPVAKPWRQPRAQDRTAFHQLCRPACACEGDARQARSACAQGGRARSGPAGGRASGGAQASGPNRHRASSRSQGRWAPPWRLDRHGSPSRVVLSWPRLHLTTHYGPRRSASTAPPARVRQSAGAVF